MGEGKNFFPGLAAVDIYILTKGTTDVPGRRPFSPHLRLVAGNLDIREHNIWGAVGSGFMIAFCGMHEYL